MPQSNQERYELARARADAAILALMGRIRAARTPSVPVVQPQRSTVFNQAVPFRNIERQQAQAAKPQPQTPTAVVNQLGDIGHRAMQTIGLNPFGSENPDDAATMRVNGMFRTVPATSAELPDVLNLRKGFYSTLRRAIEEKMPNVGFGPQIGHILRNPQSGVKAEEIAWSGVDDWIKAQPGKINKQDVLEYLQQHELGLEEIVKGSGTRVEQRTKDGWAVIEADGSERIVNSAEAQSIREGTPTKFHQYQLPGGENYREMLITMPESKTPISFEEYFRQTHPGGTFETLSPGAQAVARRDYERYGQNLSNPANFTGGHYSEPNVLAHVRFNDRTGPNGEKILHIEEIQSDWHQKARKARKTEIKRLVKDEGVTKEEATDRVPVAFGYQPQGADLADLERQYAEANKAHSATADARSKALDVTKYGDLPRAEAIQRFEAAEAANTAAYAKLEAIRKRLNQDTPNAPFKTNWHEPAMKRILRDAVEKGYDRVTWTTGKQQVDHYEDELRKSVDEIRWRPETAHGVKTGNIRIEATKGNSDVFQELVPLHGSTQIAGKDVDLEDVLGKTMARRIREAMDPKHADFNPLGDSFKGEDLTIGGEGMKGFYDQMLRDFANSYTKKWGGKVEPFNIQSGESKSRYYQGPRFSLSELEKVDPKWEHGNLENQLSAIRDAVRDGGDFHKAMDVYGSEALAEKLGGQFLKKPKFATVHSLKITPQMRESIKQRGQPLFTVVPPAVVGALGARRDEDQQ